jgi:hypothetical protein
MSSVICEEVPTAGLVQKVIRYRARERVGQARVSGLTVKESSKFTVSGLSRVGWKVRVLELTSLCSP